LNDAEISDRTVVELEFGSQEDKDLRLRRRETKIMFEKVIRGAGKGTGRGTLVKILPIQCLNFNFN
jgi:hypothetical protein